MREQTLRWTRAYGLGEGFDLNQLGVSGFFDVDEPTNGPDTGHWFVMCLVNSEESPTFRRILQVAYDFDDGTQYHREYTGSWGSWVSIHSGGTGAGYAASATNSLVLANNASRSFTVSSGLAYSVGGRIRASSAADPTKWMEGVITAYSSVTLTALMDKKNGAGTFADWNINLAGEPGADGAAGAAGSNGSNGAGYGGTSATSLALTDSLSRAFTTQAGLAYVVGSRVRAVSASDTTKWMEGVATAYSGTTLTILMDNKLGAGTFNDWNLSIAGVKGDTGSTGATGSQGSAGQGVATGGSTGQQLRKASGTNYDTEWFSESFDLATYFPGAPTASQVILRFTATRAYTFAAAIAGSYGSSATAATAQTDIDVKKNGSSVGTIRFAAAASTSSFIAASGFSLAAGDVLTLVAPGSADATLANIAITLVGTR